MPSWPAIRRPHRGRCWPRTAVVCSSSPWDSTASYSKPGAFDLRSRTNPVYNWNNIFPASDNAMSLLTPLGTAITGQATAKVRESLT